MYTKLIINLMIKKISLIAALAAVLLPATLMAQPKVKGPKFDKEKVSIVAHRGYWNCEAGGMAKNSVAALKAAQDLGFWGSEFDVNMTRDGVLLVWHDNNVNGKRIEDHNYSEFKDIRLKNGEPIPTMDDYLIQAKKNKNTVLVYELKSHSTPQIEDRFVDMTIKKLKEHKLYDPKRVMFISFSFHMCLRLSQLCPGFTVQYLNDDRTPEELDRYGINGIDFHYNVFYRNPDWCNQAKGLGMSVNSWTVNKEEDIDKIIKTGVHFITTDYPELVREKIGKHGKEEQPARR